MIFSIVILFFVAVFCDSTISKADIHTFLPYPESKQFFSLINYLGHGHETLVATPEPQCPKPKIVELAQQQNGILDDFSPEKHTFMALFWLYTKTTTEKEKFLKTMILSEIDSTIANSMKNMKIICYSVLAFCIRPAFE